MCEVKRVTRTGPNMRIFRYVARESCGESYQPLESDRLLFAYERGGRGERSVIGVASYHSARLPYKQPSSDDFLDDFFHSVTYMFVKPYHKGQGVGSQMMRFVLREMRKQTLRPVRVQSADRSVSFFQRNGFVRTGETVDCVCSGSPLFSRLVNMEYTLT